MKTVLPTVILLLWFQANANAETEVFPTGNPASDFANLAAAMESGGVVRLRAHDANGEPRAFELGPFDQIQVSEDTVILGETVAGAMTKISGGWQALLVICSDYYPDYELFQYVCTTEPPRVTVRGVHFDGQTYAAVRHVASTYAEYSNNRFTNIVGGPYFNGATKAQGIWVNGAAFALESIRGDFLVENNVFENMFAEVGYGFVALGLAADLVVRGNTIRNTDAAGIGVFLYSGQVLIENNEVLPGPGYPSDLPVYGNGIWITGYLPEGAGGTAWVRHNRVVCENPLADGIGAGFGAHNTTITNNHVTMIDSNYGALTAYAVTGATFSQNRVDGSGAFALNAQPAGFPGAPVTAATAFIGNNISGFSSDLADVFVGELVEDTLLVGSSGSVIDLGINSSITGFTQVPNQSAPGLSDVLGQRLADFQAAARGPMRP